MIKTPKVPLHPDPESDGQPKSVIKVTFNETTTKMFISTSKDATYKELFTPNSGERKSDSFL